MPSIGMFKSKIRFDTVGLLFTLVESGPPDKIRAFASLIDLLCRISASQGIISQ